jgi:hypothetical protein
MLMDHGNLVVVLGTPGKMLEPATFLNKQEEEKEHKSK